MIGKSRISARARKKMPLLRALNNGFKKRAQRRMINSAQKRDSAFLCAQLLDEIWGTLGLIVFWMHALIAQYKVIFSLAYFFLFRTYFSLTWFFYIPHPACLESEPILNVSIAVNGPVQSACPNLWCGYSYKTDLCNGLIKSLCPVWGGETMNRAQNRKAGIAFTGC